MLNILKAYNQSIVGEGEYSTGLNQIVLEPTGSGKSLCFLLPSMVLDGATLVIYPLLSLMKDQETKALRAKIPCVSLHGGMTQEERDAAYTAIHKGAKLIIANPEILLAGEVLQKLKACHIVHIAIDEVHCVTQWGESFRPSYLKLSYIITELKVKVVTAFTATASPPVLDRIKELVFSGKALVLKDKLNRPNIKYHIQYSLAKKHRALLLALSYPKPLLIFCGTRYRTEALALDLATILGKAMRHCVGYYHAGLTAKERERVEQWFMASRDGILCCTCAYGMGVDKSDIRTVIHLSPSPTVESYIQEAGRGGRDGKDCHAILLWGLEDVRHFNNMLAMAHKSYSSFMLQYASATTCLRQMLLDALGGEEAICTGCDICNKVLEDGKLSREGSETKVVLDYITRHKGVYNMEDIVPPLQAILNSIDCALVGQALWEAKDITLILKGLLDKGYIYTRSLIYGKALSAKGTAPLRFNSLKAYKAMLSPPQL